MKTTSTKMWLVFGLMLLSSYIVHWWYITYVQLDSSTTFFSVGKNSLLLTKVDILWGCFDNFCHFHADFDNFYSWYIWHFCFTYELFLAYIFWELSFVHVKILQTVLKIIQMVLKFDLDLFFGLVFVVIDVI